MNQDERSRVIHGQVRYRDQWISIEEKEAREKEFRTRVEKGYVLFQDEWMTIDEKLARVTAAQTPAQQTRQTIYNNPVVNRQVYNIQANTDNRAYSQTSEEHRHIHVDPAAIQPPAWQQQPQNFSQYLNQQFPDQQTFPAGQGNQRMIPGQAQEEQYPSLPRRIQQPHSQQQLPPPPRQPLPGDDVPE